jgi:CheY-like chemotaxis protein
VRSVLIVDDDPFIRKLVATTLGDVGDYKLVEARDGREALDLAVAQPPEIVFLDIDMPELDGIEACRGLRSRPETAQSTIVMLTAAVSAEAERAAEDAGADLFLTKPFSPLELLRLVDDLSGN